MPQIHNSFSKAMTAVLVLAIASIVLSACGSSSKSSTATSASASSSVAGAARGPGRFAALRECLQKNGVTTPKFTPGQRPPGAGGFLGASGGAGGPQLPKGMTRSQYEAVLKKCGADFSHAGGFSGLGSRFNSTAVKAALNKFASCMRENGVNVPSPNTSGKGPVFDTKGLDPTGTKFKEAESKCRPNLQGAFRARPGAGQAPATPPASG